MTFKNNFLTEQFHLFFTIYYYFWSCLVFVVQVCGLSLLAVSGGYFLYNVWASHCSIFCYRAWALGVHTRTHTTNKEQYVTKTVCVTCNTQNIYLSITLPPYRKSSLTPNVDEG